MYTWRINLARPVYMRRQSAKYLACNSLILKKQNQTENGHLFASSESNEASAQAQGVIRARDCVRRTFVGRIHRLM